MPWTANCYDETLVCSFKKLSFENFPPYFRLRSFSISRECSLIVSKHSAVKHNVT